LRQLQAVVFAAVWASVALGAGEVMLWQTPCEQVYDFDELRNQGKLPLVGKGEQGNVLQRSYLWTAQTTERLSR